MQGTFEAHKLTASEFEWKPDREEEEFVKELEKDLAEDRVMQI